MLSVPMMCELPGRDHRAGSQENWDQSCVDLSSHRSSFPEPQLPQVSNGANAR